MATHVIGNQSTMIFLTGLSGAGKSTIADLLVGQLPTACILDGDKVRKTYADDLPHGKAGLEENTNRLIKLALKHLREKQTVISAFVAPNESLREKVKNEIKAAGFSFLEIYVKTPLKLCQARDPKGLYNRAIQDKTIKLAGLTEKYDEPKNPDFICETEGKAPSENTFQILSFLRKSFPSSPDLPVSKGSCDE